ncbi:sugar transferase, PEP-CTERM/EpsH1 system associated [Hymenobacter daecheongensis DSM 21074]|uniref:Sugar transferase, PEP-CTERM/EpsH1 system associated n=1 Tax=Hymenobacter daecheongensis DSM 21074 TaxID=1121955 RepID=A0A1M6JNK5_9BACT|nr:glycosyltransferase [Hymenobacter daecheongensis]SHJ48218.1 sugar transferase, PEP-CTERM/EpsH1 system associated [Hymenobacter daecheongensis DSM 21074]
MKLLVLLSRFPFPLDKGDKLRAYHQLRYLARHHEICLLALTDEAVTPEAEAAVRPLCRGGLHVHTLHKPGIAANMARALATGRPLQVGYFYDSAAQRRLDALLREFQPRHIYCQLIRMAEYLRPHAGRYPMTLDYMDVFSAGMARRAGNAPAWQRPVMALEARRLLAYEAEAFGWFQHHSIISDQDRQLINHPQRQQIHVVLNGIDTDFFQPTVRPKEHDIVFCGNMSYHPNVDAAVFLATEILPLVQQAHPAARLLIAGTTPAPRVLALASPHVSISGWLPDIRDAYASARVFVAPMRVGTGLQNKLLEAMAMRLPCVTTPLANNALRGTPGQDLLVGETAAELAAHITRLLAEAPLAEALAARGQEFVRQQYNWAAATRKLEVLFEE